MSKPGWLAVIALAVVLGWILVQALAGDKAGATSGKSKPQPLVELVRTRAVDLPHIVEAPGHVVPLNEVDLRPQMEGVVSSLNFEEGQDVEAGQLLFVLDAGDAHALVRQAQAKYAQIGAELADAQRNYERSKELVASRFVSPSALDAAESKVHMLQAQQRAAQAEVEGSQVKAGHARIVAPISGRAGAVSVRRGALVRPSDAASLVRIVQLDPIAVEFSLPEHELATLTRAVRDGEASVTAETDQGPIRGEIVFTDNAIDPATGTLRLKARFDNADHRLWPGAFVRLRVAAGTTRGAVVLPPQAVLEGPEGHFVYEVDEGSMVHARPVKFERLQDGLAVVAGLAPDEAIVSEGNQSIQEGTVVRTQPAPAAGKP